jgi:aspartate/methionine/tyrosine aminotransferase
MSKDNDLKIDLKIGNTDLLKETLLKSPAQRDTFKNDILSGMDYNKEGPLELVKRAIRDLHDKYHPGLVTSESKIVVGSGASQLISCFFHLNKKSHALSPFWFRIPILANMHNSSIEYAHNLEDIKSIKLITYPNNPDGSLFIGDNKQDWYDAVYLWPWYFDDNDKYKSAVNKLIKAPKNVAMFSLSKMTGHCGTRFGWAIVNDEHTYKDICNYMEYESGGLGFDTQMKASQIIENSIYYNSWILPLETVGLELSSRKQQLSQICQALNWKYTSNPGMFAWITTDNEKIFYDLDDACILSTPGAKCGGTSNQVRLNLAVDSKSWKMFIEALNREFVDASTQ